MPQSIFFSPSVPMRYCRLLLGILPLLFVSNSFAESPSVIGCTPVTREVQSSQSLAILDNGQVVSALAVAGVSAYLMDVDVRTSLTHPRPADLDITVRSPAGTTVTLTSDNGGSNGNVFNGTVWDDSAPVAVTEKTFFMNVLGSPLIPEGALGAFRGEDPNGSWELTVTDDTPSVTGQLQSWSLLVTTCEQPQLTAAPVVFSSSNLLQIPDSGAPVVSQIVGSGLGISLCNVKVRTFIEHEFPGDLSVELVSPQGIVTPLTTRNGGGSDNVFNGTEWRDDAPFPVTDYPFQNQVLATPCVPEGALGSMIGNNPNGAWSLILQDLGNGVEGRLAGWSIEAEACVSSTDSDGDGVLNEVDNCTAKPNPDQADGDGDVVGDLCDQCSLDSAKSLPGACGCGFADSDSDGDGAANCIDTCSADPEKTDPGVCGCGVKDVDDNKNGFVDCSLSDALVVKAGRMHILLSRLTPPQNPAQVQRVRSLKLRIKRTLTALTRILRDPKFVSPLATAEALKLSRLALRASVLSALNVGNPSFSQEKARALRSLERVEGLVG